MIVNINKVKAHHRIVGRAQYVSNLCIFLKSFIAMSSPITFTLHTFFYSYIIKRNIDSKKSMTCALEITVGYKKIGHFRSLCNYRELFILSLEVKSP